jgi:hypothetical protein
MTLDSGAASQPPGERGQRDLHQDSECESTEPVGAGRGIEHVEPGVRDQQRRRDRRCAGHPSVAGHPVPTRAYQRDGQCDFEVDLAEPIVMRGIVLRQRPVCEWTALLKRMNVVGNREAIRRRRLPAGVSGEQRPPVERASPTIESGSGVTRDTLSRNCTYIRMCGILGTGRGGRESTREA